MKLIDLASIDKAKVANLFIKHWGSTEMVISTGVYQCDTLNGYSIVNENGEIIGLITYIIDNDACEIISLDSMEENKGIGTKLVEKVVELARDNHCKKVKLITTNDNIHALMFYQKRGFRITEILPNAVDKARKIKPEIPLVADNGIPIRDELLLEKEI